MIGKINRLLHFLGNTDEQAIRKAIEDRSNQIHLYSVFEKETPEFTLGALQVSLKFPHAHPPLGSSGLICRDITDGLFEVKQPDVGSV